MGNLTVQPRRTHRGEGNFFSVPLSIFPILRWHSWDRAKEFQSIVSDIASSTCTGVTEDILLNSPHPPHPTEIESFQRVFSRASQILYKGKILTKKVGEIKSGLNFKFNWKKITFEVFFLSSQNWEHHYVLLIKQKLRSISLPGSY